MMPLPSSRRSPEATESLDELVSAKTEEASLDAEEDLGERGDANR